MLYFEQNFNTIALICTVQWQKWLKEEGVVLSRGYHTHLLIKAKSVATSLTLIVLT